MRRLDALTAVYPQLEQCVVVTIMGAVAAEVQSLGHRPNFFYLQHAMGLASSLGLGIALARPELQVVVLDGDGSLLMNLGSLTTMARYRPPNLIHIVFDNESLLSVGGFPTATATGSDLAAIAAAAGVPRTRTVRDTDAFMAAVDDALVADELTTIVAKVEATGPATFRTDLSLLENRFQFQRYLRAPREQSAGAPRSATSLRRVAMPQVLMRLIDDLVAGRLKVVDLTQPLGPDTPVIELPPLFAASPGLTIEVISRYDERGPAWYWNTLHLGEHTGTHFDAPVHWITGKNLPDNACDTIPVQRFIGLACVLDVTREVAQDADFLLRPEHILGWEAQHGRIPAGAWVLLRTDWSKRTSVREFFNADAQGAHTPGFHASASELLARERDVQGVGVETVGTDAGQAATFDPPFPNHTIMHGAGKFGLASLCNLDQLPPTGAIVVAAPLKIVQGSGSPVRVLAIAPTS